MQHSVSSLCHMRSQHHLPQGDVAPTTAPQSSFPSLQHRGKINNPSSLLVQSQVHQCHSTKWTVSLGDSGLRRPGLGGWTL